MIDERRGRSSPADVVRRQGGDCDCLTGLPNKSVFLEQVASSLALARLRRQRLAVLFLDLDRFKTINNSLGHQAGDDLLRTMARRIESTLRGGGAVTRFGGDEFAVLVGPVWRAEDATAVARELVEAVKRPAHVLGRDLVITTSVGISLYPDDAGDAESLLDNAHAAAYRAKEEGRDHHSRYAASMTDLALKHLSLEHRLRGAFEREELLLHYQPVIDLHTGRVEAVEALVRWQHPQLGLLGAEAFIGLAELTGLISAIGEWTLWRGCADVQALREAGHGHLGLCVNLSAHQFDRADLVERIAAVLRATRLAPEGLELEVTESVAMRSMETTSASLRRLRDLGIHIAIDDFGTGYSSLSYLKRFSLDALKIDRSFIRDLAVDGGDAVLVTAMISIAHARRLRAVAEGVETEGQLRFLMSNGCDQAQGYLLARPLPLAELAALLTEPLPVWRPGGGESGGAG